MLTVLHDGIRITTDLDPATLTGDYETDAELAYITGLLAGRVGGIDSDGYVQLGDGDLANDLPPMGFIVVNAAGAFYENKPTLASRKLTLLTGPCEVITDQVVSQIEFTPGEFVYCGTDGNVGLVTNVAPMEAGARQFGIVKAFASGELTLVVIGW